MEQFTDAYIYENRPHEKRFGYSILAGGFASFNPQIHMQLFTLDYVANELHNTFVEKSLRLHNIRVILFGINEIPYKGSLEYDDYQCYEFDELENGCQVVILRGGFRAEMPSAFMDEKVEEYIGNHKADRFCHQFIESHLDMPQIRVLVFNINDFDYSIYKNSKE